MFEPFTVGGRATVLPDDGAMGEATGFAVEADRCFTLVRDADRDHLVTVLLGARGDLAQGRHGQVGDLGGVVLDPAGLGEVLGQLAVGAVEGLGRAVKGDGAHPGSARVQGEDELHLAKATEHFGAVTGLGVTGKRILLNSQK